MARRTFCVLQIYPYPFDVDKHGSCVEQLLARAVVFLVAAQSHKEEKEFHGFGPAGRGWLASQVYGCAETDSIEP